MKFFLWIHSFCICSSVNILWAVSGNTRPLLLFKNSGKTKVEAAEFSITDKVRLSRNFNEDLKLNLMKIFSRCTFMWKLFLLLEILWASGAKSRILCGLDFLSDWMKLWWRRKPLEMKYGKVEFGPGHGRIISLWCFKSSYVDQVVNRIEYDERRSGIRITSLVKSLHIKCLTLEWENH